MADVFVSYARANELRVHELVLALQAAGLSVWWDRKLEQNTQYGSIIDSEIDNATVVLVCWSGQAAKSQWVRAEADRAGEKYHGALIEPCKPPSPYNTLNHANLQDWRGNGDDLSLLDLLRRVGQLARRQDVVAFAEHKANAAQHAMQLRLAEEKAERLRQERLEFDRQQEAERRANTARNAQVQKDMRRHLIVSIVSYSWLVIFPVAFGIFWGAAAAGYLPMITNNFPVNSHSAPGALFRTNAGTGFTAGVFFEFVIWFLVRRVSGSSLVGSLFANALVTLSAVGLVTWAVVNAYSRPEPAEPSAGSPEWCKAWAEGRIEPSTKDTRQYRTQCANQMINDTLGDELRTHKSSN